MDGTEALEAPDTSATPDLGGNQPPDLGQAPQANVQNAADYAKGYQAQQAQPDPKAPKADLGGDQPLSLPDATGPSVVPQQRSMIERIGDAVIDFLSPPDRTTPVVDANGHLQNVPAPSLTRGQQFGHLMGHALQGAATAAQAPPGPGHVSQGFGNAVNQAFQQKKQEQQEQNEQAEQDFARQQKTKQDALNYQLGVRQLAAATFANSRMGVKARQDDMDFARGQEDQEQKAGSFDLGTFAGAHDVHQVMESQPKFFDRLNKGLIVGVPVYNGDGTYAGLHIFERRADHNAQAAAKGTQFATFEPPAKPGEAPKYVWHTAADGQYSNGDISRFNLAAQNASAAYDKQQADLAHTKAETTQANAGAVKDIAEAKTQPSVAAKNYAEANAANQSAAKTRTETQKLNDADSAADIESNAQQLVEGTADPSNLSKRSKSYDATIAAADRISKQTTGKPFDLAKAAGDYKFATSPATYNLLNYLDSLTGRDGKGGNLATLTQMSGQLKQTQFPAVNKVKQWAKLSAGNPQIAAYHAAITEVSDQVAKILQGGGTGSSTSDAKLKQAGELFNSSFNASQVGAVAGTMNELLQNRKVGVIGDNRYLQHWRQPKPAAPPQQAPQQQGAPQSGGFNWGAHPVAQ